MAGTPSVPEAGRLGKVETFTDSGFFVRTGEVDNKVGERETEIRM